MDIASVAIYSDADSSAPHVRHAREATRIGPGPVSQSYLLGDRILEIAKATGADAVHPGYGLLSESPEFAAAVESSGVAFIGPTAEQIAAFGRKERARALAVAAGVPVCPGSGLVHSADEAIAESCAIGFPLLLKAAAGGGGIGLRLCRDAGELAHAFEGTRRQAESHFGSADVFLERFVAEARHVEVQVFGNGRGGVVSLGLRDCSLQRRRQKVVEEAPARGLDDGLDADIERAACELARSVAYRSAGTVELLVDPHARTFYFLEVNTRLQVEHTVTELLTGIDLVEWMVRLAAGDATCMDEYAHSPSGHAIEVRLYAEDPAVDFRPSAGVLTDVVWPAGVRVDTWIERGTDVSPFYDPLLAKVVVHGHDRRDAIARMQAALRETQLGGIPTNLEYARQVMRWPAFCDATHHTRSLDAFPYVECAVRVVRPGAATTVQEHPGRIGYWSVGVPPSGPMDSLAFRIANRVVGNAAGVAGLEIAVEGPELRFTRASVVCLGGARIEVELDGCAAPHGCAVEIAAGAMLRLGRITGGARAYLAVRGGIDVPRYLGSRATFTLGGFGGHCGRGLVAGDVLPLGDPSDAARAPDPPLSDAAAAALFTGLTGDSAPTVTPGDPRAFELRVLDGPHGAPDFFTAEDLADLYSATYEVHHQSARTGVRLVGPRPRWARPDGGDAGLHPSNIHDTAYAVGSVDFTGDMPVILGPDGPSLGGFVCPAVVTLADLWKLGQLRAGDRVALRAIDADTALALAAHQDACIAARQCLDAPAPHPHTTPAHPGAPRGPHASGVLETRAAEAHRPAVVYRQSGERHLLVELGPCVLDLDLRVRIQILWEALRAGMATGELRGIVDLTPGVRSLQVQLDPRTLTLARAIDAIDAIERALPSGDALELPTRVVHLPLSFADPATEQAIARYMEVVRPDAPWCPSNLEFIRRINGLGSIDDVRRIVFDASYLVLGLGDVYLGAPVATPLDPRHRLVTTKYNPARTWTPENAVGIGGAYLCVYGMEGPGGYQLVGRTVPVWSSYERFAGAAAGRPWLLRSFDQIRFFPVEASELLEWRRAVREGRVELTIEASRFDLAEHRRMLDAHRDGVAAFRAQQQAAFEDERARWVASGELDAVARLARDDVPIAAAAALDDAGADGAEIVTAVLTAQVVAVYIVPGQRIGAGEPLVVLAAMKTETLVVAPTGGVVERILCSLGQMVAAGAPLVAMRAGPVAGGD
jgi:urea carboxylase